MVTAFSELVISNEQSSVGKNFKPCNNFLHKFWAICVKNIFCTNFEPLLLRICLAQKFEPFLSISEIFLAQIMRHIFQRYFWHKLWGIFIKDIFSTNFETYFSMIFLAKILRHIFQRYYWHKIWPILVQILRLYSLQ